MSDSQSAFQPGESCINKVFSIDHKQYHVFDDSVKVKTKYLDNLTHLIRYDTRVFLIQTNIKWYIR